MMPTLEQWVEAFAVLACGIGLVWVALKDCDRDGGDR